MSSKYTLPLILSLGLLTGGCVVSVGGDGPDFDSSYRPAKVEAGERIVVIEEPVANRPAGADVVDAVLADSERAGCKLVSASRYTQLKVAASKDDHHGARVVLSCPATRAIF